MGYANSTNYQSRPQANMYGAPIGHTPAPCHGPPTRLPPHNPRLHAPPKHGHVSRNLCFHTILQHSKLTWDLTNICL